MRDSLQKPESLVRNEMSKRRRKFKNHVRTQVENESPMILDDACQLAEERFLAQRLDDIGEHGVSSFLPETSRTRGASEVPMIVITASAEIQSLKWTHHRFGTS